MRIAVFSDSHGVKEPMLAAIEEQKPDMVLHLGDYVRDAEAIAAYFPSLDLRYVRGNCDAYSRSDAEENLLFNADGVRIFMTHGHRYNVKLGYESLANAAHFSGAQLALFGHTHEADFLRMGDVTLFNPGSAGMGRQTYGSIRHSGSPETILLFRASCGAGTCSWISRCCSPAFCSTVRSSARADGSRT